MGFYDDHRHYIYTLLNNGSVIYVGVSSDVKNRYKDHHYSSISNVYNLARYLLANNTPLTADIIDFAPNKRAGHKLEMLYIAKYSTKYHLLNDKEVYLAINSIIPVYKQIINPYSLCGPYQTIEKTQQEWENK